MLFQEKKRMGQVSTFNNSFLNLGHFTPKVAALAHPGFKTA
jgi:hypothetical protein